MTAQDVRAGAVRAYEPAGAEAWDDLVKRSVNGTILQTRRFLAYHGDRFRDRSLLVTDDRGRLVGVFPAAADPGDPAVVTSHPGLTYGGLVQDGSLYGTSMIWALGEIADEYRALGYKRLRYKAVPYIYQSAPAGDDMYALSRLGASRCRCDLAAVIHLATRGRARADRRRACRRAEAAGVHLEEGWQNVASFWRILEMNLATRHGAAPTHSLADIEYLHERFPHEIILVAAKVSDAVVGGSVYFSTGPVLHQQYTAATEEGRAVHGTDLVIERSIALAHERGHRYISFGTSTLGNGQQLNESQYEFKISFGGGGVTHDQYELVL
jgi:Acetyltransferase (GNAT) domain